MTRALKAILIIFCGVLLALVVGCDVSQPESAKAEVQQHAESPKLRSGIRAATGTEGIAIVHGWLVQSVNTRGEGTLTILTVTLHHDNVVYKAYCDSSWPASFLPCTQLDSLVGKTLRDTTDGSDENCKPPGCVANTGFNKFAHGDVLHFNGGWGAAKDDAILFVTSKTTLH